MLLVYKSFCGAIVNAVMFSVFVVDFGNGWSPVSYVCILVMIGHVNSPYCGSCWVCLDILTGLWSCSVHRCQPTDTHVSDLSLCVTLNGSRVGVSVYCCA